MKRRDTCVHSMCVMFTAMSKTVQLREWEMANVSSYSLRVWFVISDGPHVLVDLEIRCLCAVAAFKSRAPHPSNVCRRLKVLTDWGSGFETRPRMCLRNFCTMLHGCARRCQK